ncbi:MAG: urea ABC transporter permease subunit UrtB [Phocaeicola sp.]
MRNKILFLIICLIRVGWLSAYPSSKSPSAFDAFSAVDSLSLQVNTLLSGTPEEVSSAWIELCRAPYVNSWQLIDAAMGGRLYRCEVDAVQLASKGTVGVAVEKYYIAIEQRGKGDYFYLYPQVKEVKDPSILSVVEPVKLTRKDRTTLAAVLPVAQLYHSQPEVRLAAYQQIGVRQEEAWLPDVERAADLEQSDELQAAAYQTLHTLYLLAGSDTQQTAAMEYLFVHKTAQLHTLLRNYSERQGVSKENRKHASKELAQWNMKERNNQIYQNVFSGLSLGSILVLVALGLSIIYGLAGIINMSHGEFLMIGAYTTYCIQQFFECFLPESWMDLSFFVSLPLSFIVTACMGLLIERLIIRHLYHRPLESLLATWGISLILIQLARTLFGDLTTVKSPVILSGGWMVSEGLMLPYNRLFIMALSLLLFLAVYLLFGYTRLGVKVRAVTQNRQMSACVGISTKQIDMTTFMLGSGLAGIAGCALTLVGNVVPDMGQTYIVDSFLVVVTGGVGKLVGCVASGFSMGVLSKAFEAAFEAVYGKVFLLFLVILFLQYRPKGLFADKGRIGDD